VHTVADLYRLTLDDFLEMKRRADERDGITPETVKAGKVATRWAENLIAAIDASRNTTLERLLYALGIRDVGESTAKTLAKHFGALAPIMEADVETLRHVPDVGPSSRRVSPISSPSRITAKSSPHSRQWCALEGRRTATRLRRDPCPARPSC
jgi:NAD-dependent DNA ligase